MTSSGSPPADFTSYFVRRLPQLLDRIDEDLDAIIDGLLDDPRVDLQAEAAAELMVGAARHSRALADRFQALADRLAGGGSS